MVAKPEAVNADANIEEFTFGVEIECALPTREIDQLHITVGTYHRGYPMPSTFFPGGWKAEEDSSLTGFGSEYTALEVVSPILSGLSGLKQIAAVIDQLNRHGMKVNKTCGLHVHVGMKSVLGVWSHDYDRVAQWLRHLLSFISRHELALFAIGGNPARMESHYCRTIKGKAEYQRMGSHPSYHMFEEANDHPHADRYHEGDRYHTLNVCSLFERDTVEFRLFAATTNATKVIGYIIVALGIAYKAAIGTAVNKFESADSDKRDAVKAVARLWQRLDWNRSTHRYGFPSGAVEEYYDAIRKNQKWNANNFVRLLEAWNPESLADTSR